MATNKVSFESLNRRIVFQDYDENTDAFGTFIKIWYNAFEVWAQVKARAYKKHIAAQDADTELQRYIIEMRYHPEISTRMRIKYKTRVLYIESIRNPGGDSQYLIIEAIARPNDNY